MRPVRFMSGALVAGVILSAFSIGLVVPPANAVVITGAIGLAPGVPGPLNILPSTVIGAKAALSGPEALVTMLLPYIKDGSFIRAADAASRSAATVEQAALVVAEAEKFAVPAVKASPLLKVAAGANVAVIGLTTGMMIGGAGARVFGFKDDMVCQEQNGILTAVSFVTNGVSCKAYDNKLQEAQRNLGEPESITAVDACMPGGGDCYRYARSFVYNAANTALCYSRITNNGNGANQVAKHYYSAPTGSSGAGQGSGCVSPAPYYVLIPTDQWGDLQGVSWNVNGSGASNIGTITKLKSNPTRQLECKLNYSDASSSSRLSDTFTENDPAFAPIKCPTPTPGKTVTGTKITEVGGAAAEVLLDKPTTPEYQAMKSAHPTCMTGSCFLNLLKEGVSCFEVAAPCADWFADPDKTSKYSCTFNNAAVALAECTTYAPRFKADAAATGNALADPETGLSVPGVKTGAGTVTLPGETVQDPAKTRDCYPSGWGVLNPVEWVLKPVKCALEYAFVPSRDSVDKFKSAWTARVNASSIGTVGRLLLPLSIIPTATGCEGLPLPLQFFGQTWEGRLFAACTEPMAGVAATVKNLGGFLIIAAGLLAVVRYIANIVGYSGYGGSSSSGAGESSVSFADSDYSGDKPLNHKEGGWG